MPSKLLDTHYLCEIIQSRRNTNSGCLRNFDIEASSLVTSLVWLTAIVSRASTVFIPMSNQDNHTEHQLFNKVSQERAWFSYYQQHHTENKKENTVFIAAVSPENIHNTFFRTSESQTTNLFNWANFEIKKTYTIFTIFATTIYNTLYITDHHYVTLYWKSNKFI